MMDSFFNIKNRIPFFTFLWIFRSCLDHMETAILANWDDVKYFWNTDAHNKSSITDVRLGAEYTSV